MGFINAGIDKARACLKRFVVFLAVRGWMPARMAESLIRRLGLGDA